MQKAYFVSDGNGVGIRKCGQPAISKVEGALDLDLHRLHTNNDFGLMLFLAVFYLNLEFLKLVDLLGTMTGLRLEGARKNVGFGGGRGVPLC